MTGQHKESFPLSHITHHITHPRNSDRIPGEQLMLIHTCATLLLLDILENVPEEVGRLFRVPLTPIVSIDDSEPKSGFVTHQPFEITTKSVTAHLNPGQG